MYTAISRKVVGKNVHATIPKGNMGYDQYTVPDDCTCRTYFCCFPLALANTFHGLSCQFFQISRKNSELKTTHNTFQDCRMHFFRQPFLKQLYNLSLFPASSKLPICIIVVPNIYVSDSSSYTLLKRRSTSAIRRHIMHQLVAYKKLKTMEK